MDVRPVEEDARGIIDPATGLARFRLDRHPPSPALARFVDRHWVATWDLTGREPFTQRVLAHPVVNLVFTDGTATVHGPAAGPVGRRLDGRGWALGVMFRPAGFRSFADRPLHALIDTSLPAGEALPGGEELERAVRDLDPGDPDAVAPLLARVEDFLAALAPADPHPAEGTRDIVERVAADPTALGVADLAAREGLGVRLLQRRFADHVGPGPKSVIRRYRFYEAAERARRGTPPDWGRLAVELGFSDQAHLTREFTAVIGVPPGRYAARARAGR
ncbi:helix-turn-helix transcriptional regulator [Nocardiopsis sp. N85]|uniref:helix-turn-helix transcriptional regulator n=1 Tax=Nocardiopsis sp. N85 TaxID=3029400 RepID=UPI00237FBED0|nr:helix-turn-helix transcriptional regulator [Nocardiopsis sp. N85]MDE3724892.1 helix-turn-helix transcriptional regulator [Nocardiopsis sp. N85]